MDLFVSYKTVQKVEDIFKEKGIVTQKDIPDLNCQYICQYLYDAFLEDGLTDVALEEIKLSIFDFVNVLYDKSRFSHNEICHYLKKLKF